MRHFVVYLSLLAILLHGALGMPVFGSVVVCAGDQTSAIPTAVDNCCQGGQKDKESDGKTGKSKSGAGSPSCHCCNVVQVSGTDLTHEVSAAAPQPAGFLAAPFRPLLSNEVVLPAVPPPRA